MPSNLTKRSQRKKQTRLAFDSVEPSSSTTMSPTRIRYQTSAPHTKPFDFISPAEQNTDDGQSDVPAPGKKYTTVTRTPKKEKKNSRLPFKPLATPVASSQTERSTANLSAYSNISDSDSDIDIALSSRYQRAAFTNGSSSPRNGGPIHQISETTKSISAGKRCHHEGFDGAENDSSAGSSPEEEQWTPRKKSGSAILSFQSATSCALTISDDESEAVSPLASPIRAKPERGRDVLPTAESSELSESTTRPRRTNARSFISGGSSYSAPIPKTTPKRAKTQGSSALSAKNKKGRKEKVIAPSDDDDSGDVWALPTPRQTRGLASQRMKRVISATTNLPQRESNSDGDNDNDNDQVVRSSLKRRLQRPAHEEEEEEEEEDDDDDDDEPVISSPLKRRRIITQVDSDSDVFESPLRLLRSGSKVQSKPKPKPEMDMENSKPEDTPQRLTRQKQQKKSHRTEREKKLELLRRQRAGEKITELTESESDDQSQHGLYDSDNSLQALSEFEDEEIGDGVEHIQKSLRPITRKNLDDYDEDFVVDDDEEPLGVPEYGLHDIPLEFTHHAHKPLKEHFKDAIEWLVQNKINPAFNRSDPIYSQAFKKLNDEVHGYAISKYVSSVWREPFTRALYARPVFLEETIDPGDMNEGRKCDACGRSNHPARYILQFDGKAYHKDTLDEVDNDHDSDEDDNASVDSKGQMIPTEDETWYVGSHCKANAETAHSLIHWKHALNTWVLDQLKTEGHLSPAKLALREEWNKKKRNDYALSIVDDWAYDKQIRDLYRDFKANLEAAREGKQGRWSVR